MDRYDLVDAISTLFTGAPATMRKRRWYVWGITITTMILVVVVFVLLDTWGVI